MMKNSYYIIILKTLFIGSINFGCSTPEKENFHLVADTLAIPISSVLLSDYFQYSFIEDNDGLRYVSGYNYQLSQLDIFDFSNKRFVNSIPLHHDGPDAVNSLLNAHFITLDSILIIGSFELYVINRLGEVTIKHSLNIPSRERSANEERDYRIMPFVSNLSPIREGNKVYLGKFPYFSQFEKNFYIRYDISTGKVENLNMFYPDFFQKSSGQYKHKWAPQVEWLNDKFYYTFPATSYIWSYDPQKNETFEYKVSSNFNRDFASPTSDFPGLHEVEYDKTELEYLRLHFLKDIGQVLRIHRKRKAIKENKWEFYLMVMDLEMNVIAEFEIKDSHYLYPYQAFSDGRGLYVPIKSEYTGEENLSFMYIQVVPIE